MFEDEIDMFTWTEEDEAGTYVLLPCLDDSGENYSVFSDGSWSRWTPREAVAHMWHLAFDWS